MSLDASILYNAGQADDAFGDHATGSTPPFDVPPSSPSMQSQDDTTTNTVSVSDNQPPALDEEQEEEEQKEEEDEQDQRRPPRIHVTGRSDEEDNSKITMSDVRLAIFGGHDSGLSSEQNTPNADASQSQDASAGGNTPTLELTHRRLTANLNMDGSGISAVTNRSNDPTRSKLAQLRAEYKSREAVMLTQRALRQQQQMDAAAGVSSAPAASPVPGRAHTGSKIKRPTQYNEAVDNDVGVSSNGHFAAKRRSVSGTGADSAAPRRGKSAPPAKRSMAAERARARERARMAAKAAHKERIEEQQRAARAAAAQRDRPPSQPRAKLAGRPKGGDNVFARLAASGNYTAVVKHRRRERKRRMNRIKRQRAPAKQRPKPVEDEEDSPAVFHRLAHSSSYTQRRARLEEARGRRRKERQRQRLKQLLESDMPPVIARLTDARNFTGAVKQKLTEKENHIARMKSKIARPRALDSSPSPSKVTVFDRLTSKGNLTGISRRKHEARRGSSGAVLRRTRLPGRGSSQSRLDLRKLNLTRPQLTALLDDLVRVLSSPSPESMASAALRRLRRITKFVRSFTPWKSVLHLMVERHLKASRREMVMARKRLIGTDSVECLDDLTSPSARSLVQQLNNATGSLAFTKQLGEMFRRRRLGPQLLGGVNKTGRHAIDTRALTRAVFDQHADAAMNRSVGVVYALNVGGLVFVATAGFTKARGNPRCAAAALVSHVRAAFMAGNDNASRYELCQALRTTPVAQWRGEILQTMDANLPAAEVQLLEQVKIFEQSANFPFGLTTGVNPHVKRLLQNNVEESPRDKEMRQQQLVLEQKLAQLRIAKETMDRLQQQVFQLKEHSNDEDEPEISYMDSMISMPESAPD